MRSLPATFAIATVAIAVTSVAIGAPATQRSDIDAAVAAKSRTPANVERDRYRHPADTLAFFGVKPNQTVVEIWPGGGWYSEILAPLTAGKGQYWAVGLWPQQGDWLTRMQAKDSGTYGNVKVAAFPAFAADSPRVPDGTADVVLTFRNVHNWKMGYQHDGANYAPEAFRQMFAMLKPGGTLGIVDHRLPENAAAERELKSGYLKVSTVRRLAEDAGFVFDGSSEVNANPRDTADWPSGVWTLPPSLRLKDVDRDKYLAIGESDRMTLRFKKPA